MSCLFINFQCEEIMKNETNLITSDRIDTLGNLLADIKVLTAKADAIKDDLKDSANLSGDRTFEGDAFKALYIESNVSTVDWKVACQRTRHLGRHHRQAHQDRCSFQRQGRSQVNQRGFGP
jgi:hypothetical protein